MASIERTPAGTWRARYRDDAGKTRSRTFRRKADAHRFMAAVETDVRRGLWIDPQGGKMAFAEWAETYLAAAHDLSPSTRSSYRRDLDKYVLPRFGAMALDRITRADIKRWIGQELASGLAASSVDRHFRTLRLVLNGAVDDELLLKSPCRGVRGPAIPHQEMRFLSHQEVHRLVDAMPDRYRAMILTAAYAGLRWGEIIGLRRKSVDVDAAALTVVEQLARLDGQWVRGKPKSHAGRRRIALPRFVAEALRDHLDAFVADEPDALVFANSAGNPLHQSSFQTHHWKPAKARAGVELRFHDLRHTAVALAIQAGAHPKSIQARMGHSSVSVTLDRCGHLFPELDTDVADRLDDTWHRRLLAVDGLPRDTDRTRATRKGRRIGASEGRNRTAPVEPKTGSDLQKHLEAAPGLEPGYRDLQSLA